jgi:hypothetical protein
MNPQPTPPLHVAFDPTPEIFASDNHGTFVFPLRYGGHTHLDTSSYDELRFVVSVWHPSEKQSIDLDSAYVELRASFDPDEDHWTKLAEIEPVVPPYNSGESFDGWIVLPVLGARTGLRLFGSGFEARARLQLRASAYLVG